MKPEDDPEARIRQLEQPLADYGAVELGTSQPSGNDYQTSALPPPVYGPPYPSTYEQQSPYSTPPFGVSFPPGPTRSGAPYGLIFGLIAVVVVLIVGGIGVFVWSMSSTPDRISTRPGFPDATGGDGPRDGSVTIGPSRNAPTPLPTQVPDDQPPEVAVAPAGGQYSVSGVEKIETIECNGSNISVSGVDNIVTLLGHCQSVTVSGVENQVILDSADRIGASGFDNQVIYHSGDPEIDATSRNSVTQG
ncbi:MULTISPECIES: DUF3060 domain-containing protein [unclassified Mycobacterium]|uniref:DUF3060 domain-containing protein n=1 Tax=unclassified Mycobacterium TaxID=2642494 RepID=UPI0007417276|nr:MULTISPECIES: DUF3060 domain-containing protein [unclassified Mycobacterium]